MKSRFSICIAAVTLLAALAIPVRLAAQDKQEHHRHVRYTVIDLSTLGGTFSEPSGINTKGWVAGRATLPGDANVHAALWRGEQATDLGTLGGPNSWAWVPGDSGIIPGQAETPSPDPLGEDFCGFGTHIVCLPFLWQDGAMTPLPTLGGDNGVAVEINRRGQAVGFTENAIHDPNCFAPQVLQVVAVIWRDGKVEQQLAPFPGDTAGFAQAINERGHVTGSTGPCAPVRAVLWRSGAVIDLGSLGGSLNNFPFDINNRDEVVGDSDLPGDTIQHAFLWDGVIHDLGTLPGDTGSSTESINNRGQVAGVSYTDVSSSAFLWENGVMTDLNILTCPGSIYLANALGINDQGEIIGDTVTSSGDVHAYLATPTDDECDGESASSARPLRGSGNPRPILPEKFHNLPRGRRYHILGRTPAKNGIDSEGQAGEPHNTGDLLPDTLDGLGSLCFRCCRGCSGTGYCTLDSNNKLTGTCFGQILGSFQCASKFQPVQCPVGKQAIRPANFSCSIGSLARVDAARSCTD
jgi:probable HAF family extracellular repeat protein